MTVAEQHTQSAGSLLSPVRHVLRITIEAKTPFSISSGEPSAYHDVVLFRDWNGHPCLSGAAIAGVLRSLHEDYFGREATQNIFGYEAPRRSGDGSASRLLVSFGHVQDANGRATERWRTPQEIKSDKVLSLLSDEAPLLRDNVSISERGAAREHMKFDRSVCPAGTRFCLELGLDGDADELAKRQDREALMRTASLIASPYARFGGASRRGLGRFSVVQAAYVDIDRRGVAGRANWIAYRKLSIDEPLEGLAEISLVAPPSRESRRRPITGEIRLRAKSFWRVGQGVQAWHVNGTDKAPDLVPPKEPVIIWAAGGGRPEYCPSAPIPGASIKGAIAHRTEFHLRRLKGEVVGDATMIDAKPRRRSDSLFGSVREADSGVAGAVLLDDIYVDFSGETQQTAIRIRNSIDRHTGGVRLQKLFSDEALWRGPEIVIPITVLTRSAWQDSSQLRALDPDVVKAFTWALEDLCCGALAIGGRESAGDGVFEGSVAWGGSLAVNLTAAIEAIDLAATSAFDQRS